MRMMMMMMPTQFSIFLEEGAQPQTRTTALTDFLFEVNIGLFFLRQVIYSGLFMYISSQFHPIYFWLSYYQTQEYHSMMYKYVYIYNRCSFL